MGIRDDKLWDDLLWQLKHPLTPDQEERKRKAEESFIERKLNKVFGGAPTGGAAPIKGYVRYDKNPYEEIQKNKTLSTDEKVKRIKAISEAEKKKIDQEHALKMAKLYGGAGLEIGSAAVPGMGSTKAVTTVAKALAPKVGRKIATEIATGVVRGGVSGAVEGLGRGMLEDKNPIKTAAQDAVIGTTFGGVTGAAGQSLGKIANQIEMDSYASKIKQGGEGLKSLTPAERKKYFGLSNKYYKDYEQGVETNADTIGPVKLISNAMKETNIQKPEYSKNVVNLSKNIRNAKYVGPEPEVHPHKKYDIKQFHRLAGKDVDYLIAENKKGNNYFYKIVDPNQKSGPKPEGQNLPTNIIPHSGRSFNPALDIYEWVKRRRRLK